MTEKAPFHKSILVAEILRACACLEVLGADPQRVWDGTLGLGGHLQALATKYTNAEFYASDQDAEMLALAKQRLGDVVSGYAHANFADLPFADRGPFGFILLDLGISSAHFDYFERGFSFRFDQPLDMRMDTTKGVSAAAVLATTDEDELARIFFEYGEERYSRRIAHAVVAARRKQAIDATSQLAEICAKVYPPKHKAKGHAQRHPATRVFQALRIYVNDELGSLVTAMHALPQQICVGGRIAVITFHSLEDRIVKRAFRDLVQVKQLDPAAKSNYVQGNFAEIERGGVVPSEEEIDENPRARSARLRILERVQ